MIVVFTTATIRSHHGEMRYVTISIQIWNPDDWELFAYGLLQQRHGALNVHKIPAAHKGDFGLDYYCLKDSVAYQCYAVDEPIDIATRASRQSKKITTDLRKLVNNSVNIAKIFLGAPIKHWILLAPNHDSKEVNLHCSKKTGDVRKLGCVALDTAFEVGVQDLTSFPNSAVAIGMSGLANVKLSVPAPSQQELDNWVAGSSNLLANAEKKLQKRVAPSMVQGAVAETTKSFLEGNAHLDALRSHAPDLHEQVVATINSRARRLGFAGPQDGQTPSAVLNAELDTLISAVRVAAPSLSLESVEHIAYGAISEWIMRCPLDFPDAK